VEDVMELSGERVHYGLRHPDEFVRDFYNNQYAYVRADVKLLAKDGSFKTSCGPDHVKDVRSWPGLCVGYSKDEREVLCAVAS